MTAAANDTPRKIAVFAGMVLDSCTRVHSQGGCNATRSAIGEQCYNTYATCASQADFNQVDKEYLFSLHDGPVVRNVSAWAFMVSCNIREAPTDPLKGFAGYDSVSIVLQDTRDDDVGVDPYYAMRPWSAFDKSTFFNKLYERNMFFIGRRIKIYRGYVNDGDTVQWSDMVTREYRIRSLEPQGGGRWILRADSELKIIESRVIPSPTSAELAAQLLAGANAGTLKGDYDELPAANFYLCIDDEILKVGTRTGAAIAGLTRGQAGTTDATHAVSVRVQEVWTQIAQPVADYWRALLLEAGIDTSRIDYAGAVTEADYIHDGWLNTCYISKPTKVADLLAQSCRAWGGYTLWSAEDGKCILRMVRPRHSPTESVTEINAVSHLIGPESVSQPQEGRRFTRIIIYFGVVNWSKSLKSFDLKAPNFSRVEAYIDSTAEDSKKYGDQKPLEIYAWNVPADHSNEMASLAWRLLTRYNAPPKRVAIILEEKDAATLARTAFLRVTAPELIDTHGNKVETEMLIMSRKLPPGAGCKTGYAIEESKFDGKWWIWSPDADQEEDTHAQWCDNSGLLPNGEEGFRWA